MHLRFAALWWSVALMMLCVVAWKSLTPIAALPVSDKSGHFMVYAVLAGWFVQLGQGAGYRWAVVLMLILFGGCMELLQLQTGFRAGEWLDFVANSLGAALMVGFMALSAGERWLWRFDHWLAARLGRQLPGTQA